MTDLLADAERGALALLALIMDKTRAADVQAQITEWSDARAAHADAIAQSADLDRKNTQALADITGQRQAVDEIAAANKARGEELDAKNAAWLADTKRLADARQAFDIECSNRVGELNGRENKIADAEADLAMRVSAIADRERAAEAKRADAQATIDRLTAALPK